MSENPNPQLKEISDKLSTLIQLTVVGLLKDSKNQREKISLLSTAGIAPTRIAEILGTTGNTVNKELSVIRKSKKNTVNNSEDAVPVDAHTTASEGNEIVPGVQS